MKLYQIDYTDNVYDLVPTTVYAFAIDPVAALNTYKEEFVPVTSIKEIDVKEVADFEEEFKLIKNGNKDQLIRRVAMECKGIIEDVFFLQSLDEVVVVFCNMTQHIVLS